MYTNEMKRAFRSLDSHCPKGFSVQIVDNDYFLTVIAKEDVFMRLPSIEEKVKAVEYMIKIKKAFEMHGAIVEIMREGGKE